MKLFMWKLETARAHLRDVACKHPEDFEALAYVLQLLHDTTAERDELRAKADTYERLYTDATVKLDRMQPYSVLWTVDPEVILKHTVAFAIGTCAALQERGPELVATLGGTSRMCERAAVKVVDHLFRVVAGTEMVLGDALKRLVDTLEAMAKES